MKEQKNLQQQLTRYNDAPSNKVKKDMENLQQKIAMVSTTFQREAQNVTNLKEDMQKVNMRAHAHTHTHTHTHTHA